jgi:hypothetical protein
MRPVGTLGRATAASYKQKDMNDTEEKCGNSSPPSDDLLSLKTKIPLKKKRRQGCLSSSVFIDATGIGMTEYDRSGEDDDEECEELQVRRLFYVGPSNDMFTPTASHDTHDDLNGKGGTCDTMGLDTVDAVACVKDLEERNLFLNQTITKLEKEISLRDLLVMSEMKCVAATPGKMLKPKMLQFVSTA